VFVGVGRNRCSRRASTWSSIPSASLSAAVGDAAKAVFGSGGLTAIKPVDCAWNWTPVKSKRQKKIARFIQLNDDEQEENAYCKDGWYRQSFSGNSTNDKKKGTNYLERAICPRKPLFGVIHFEHSLVRISLLDEKNKITSGLLQHRSSGSCMQEKQ